MGPTTTISEYLNILQLFIDICGLEQYFTMEY